MKGAPSVSRCATRIVQLLQSILMRNGIDWEHSANADARRLRRYEHTSHAVSERKGEKGGRGHTYKGHDIPEKRCCLQSLQGLDR